MDNSEAADGSGAGLDLHSEAWERLEPILELFERALSRGERPALDDFVPALEPAERRALGGVGPLADDHGAAWRVVRDRDDAIAAFDRLRA